MITDLLLNSMKKLYGRGLNIAAQINPSRKNIPSFTEIEQLKGYEIKRLGCGYLQSYLLLSDGQFIRTGYYMDTLTSVRIINLHRLVPSIIPALQKLKFLSKIITFRGGNSRYALVNGELMSMGGFHDAIIGQSRGYAIDYNGEWFAVGENYFGQLGTKNSLNSEAKFTKISSINNQNIIDIGVGFQHTLFLTDNHQVFGCGKASDYQIQPEIYTQKYRKGNEKITDKIQIPELILKGHKALKVQGGHKFSMIWADQNKIFTLGNNKFGQCGFNHFKTPEVNQPRQISFLSQNNQQRIIDIACGFCHSLILTNKYVYFLGSVEQNQNPFNYYSQNLCSPTIIDLPAKPIKIFASFDRSCIITQDGSAYIFGGNDFSYCGGESGKLQKLEGYNFNENSLVGLGFSHTLIYP